MSDNDVDVEIPVDEEPAACPGCECQHAPEIASKPITLGKVKKIRSTRECRHCGRRFRVTLDAP